MISTSIIKTMNILIQRGLIKAGAKCSICGKSLYSEYAKYGIGPSCFNDFLLSLSSSHIMGGSKTVKEVIDELKNEKQDTRDKYGG